jgi:hypothetical protein
MSLFGGHYLVDHDILPIGVEEYRIPKRHMHPVTFLGGIETLDVPMRLGKISKTIYMFSYNAAIFLMKGRKEIINSLSDPHPQ